MPFRSDAHLLRPRTLGLLLILVVVCFAISAPTKDKPGVEGAISWLTFLGSWVGLVAALAVAAGLLIQRARR
jgi:hypothetical protein